MRRFLGRVADLSDRVRWNTADPSAQDVVIGALARQLEPHYRFLQTEAFEAGDCAHRIATFEHVGLGAVLHLVPGGKYERGGSGDSARLNELPAHEVLVKPLLVGRTPLLQREWDAAPGPDARHWRDPALPISSVSWEDARTWLAAREGGLRLPTEAEWEYFCRSGTQTAYFWGDAPDPAFAWYGSGGAEWETLPPELHADRSNAFGLVDVSGNLAEWCEDHYVASYHGSPCDGSARKERRGDLRVVRGGDSYNGSSHCRSAARNVADRHARAAGIGLRLVASVAW